MTTNVVKVPIRNARSGSEHFLIDASDEPLVRSHKHWYLRGDRCGVFTTVKGKPISLSRLLLGITDPDTVVDHVNGDTLNNTRINLRPATWSQNAANRARSSRSKSKYKGVSFIKYRWFASRAIRKPNGKRVWFSLGGYDTEEAAAVAYDLAQLEAYGEFARPNLPTVSLILYLAGVTSVSYRRSHQRYSISV